MTPADRVRSDADEVPRQRPRVALLPPAFDATAAAYLCAADALALFAEDRRHVARLLLTGGKSWPCYQLLTLRRNEAVDALQALYRATGDREAVSREGALVSERDSVHQLEAWAAEYRAAARDERRTEPSEEVEHG